MSDVPVDSLMGGEIERVVWSQDPGPLDTLCDYVLEDSGGDLWFYTAGGEPERIGPCIERREMDGLIDALSEWYDEG